ncbi:MAG: four-carbon acid sugar kinase family protein [Limnothrix sp. CACIAM 69d]|nr:MAG: four-carbon acid sugar kinase family protein [Limnothrix sp. CACIAM 69d]
MSSASPSDQTKAPKIIVLDDDPTGSQTVHSCLLLMRWDVETLCLGLEDASPIVFVLTNTRALTAEAADAVTREVCRNLKQAIAQVGLTDWLVVSRSDSTLRGHYPVETDAIAEELGPFDAHFLVPAFFEGGRVTRDSVHYLKVNGVDTPVHETEFARDSVFGYRHSYLPDYVAEKTAGRIPADQVERFQLADLRGDRLTLEQRLQALTGNRCCVVDGEVQADLNQFAAVLLSQASQGKRFLFRSAASILTALAALPPQPVAAEAMARYVRDGRSGVAIVGSHVRKTTEQLQQLLAEPGVVGIEVPVAELQGPDRAAKAASLCDRALTEVQRVRADGKTPVIYTSRQELTFETVDMRLEFGQAVSALLMAIERGLPEDIGYLISKGGITSNDTLSDGLALRSARLLGQILPGVSVVKTADYHPQFPNLPVVLFPGNVGDANALALVYRRLSQI